MIVLVPVSRFRVPYDTASGRPYSALEALVLDAVADGGASLESLADTFRVHERLLVESVVTLITAGWVAAAAGPQALFVLTAAGDVAVREAADPVSVVVTPARPQTVVMERVAGQVARHVDARSWSRGDLGEEAWAEAVVMRERITRNSLDEAQVQKLLQRESGQWIRRIGPIRLVSRATHYVAVDADAESGLVRGLPPAWSEALSGRVLDAARGRAETSRARGEAPPRQSGGGRRGSRRAARFAGVVEPRAASARTTPFTIVEDDVLRGPDAHASALNWALDNARSSVAIVAPAVGSVSDFRRVAELAAVAVARGVAVDLLLGDASGLAVSELVAICNALGYGADSRQGRERLRTRNPTTGSGASLLVCDAGLAPLTAIIGDHAWFGPSGASMSLQVSEPSLAADAARAVASLWTSRDWASPAWAGAAERWRRLASQAEEAGALGRAPGGVPEGGWPVLGELIIDDEHAGLAPLDGAVLLGGHRPDLAAGEAATRGVTLRLTGDGVTLLGAGN